MPLLTPRDRQALRAAWHRVLQLWRPMLAWTVLVWVGLAAFLIPLSSGFVSWQLVRGPDEVVGNEALAAWLLTPLGLLWALAAGGLAITAGVVRYAGFFRIVTDQVEGNEPSVRRTALILARRLPDLFRLCVAAVLAAAVVAVPLAAGLGGIYLALLGEHDINYYLSLQPPEWRWALILGGVWAGTWGLGAAWLAGRFILALPAWVDGHRPLRGAARRSWTLTRGHAGRLLRLLAVAVATWLLARFLVDGVFFALSSWTIGWIAEVTPSLRILALALGGHTAGSFLLDAAVGFLGFAFVATVLTKFYLEDTGLHGEAPPTPRLSELPGTLRALLDPALHPVRLIPGLVLLVFLAAAGSNLLLERIPDPGSVEIHAHRAGPPPAPENTLAALERAIDEGAHYSEIDVQRTRDGVVVVVHDADYMRVAGDPRRVRDADWAEVAELVQRPDDGSPPEERRLATLDDFLERARNRIGLNIELKYYGPDPELAPEVVRIVREAGMEDQVVLMSLSPEPLRRIRELAPDLTLGYVSAVAVGDMSRLPVDFLAVNQAQLSSHLLRSAREAEMEVLVWTANEPAAMAELILRGVDGLITDHPGRAHRVNRELRELPAAGRLLLRFHGVAGDPDPTDATEPAGDAPGPPP